MHLANGCLGCGWATGRTVPTNGQACVALQRLGSGPERVVPSEYAAAVAGFAVKHFANDGACPLDKQDPFGAGATAMTCAGLAAGTAVLIDNLGNIVALGGYCDGYVYLCPGCAETGCDPKTRDFCGGRDGDTF